jgi:hypothetical protein
VEEIETAEIRLDLLIPHALRVNYLVDLVARGILGGELLVVVLDVELEGHPDLPQVGKALRLMRLLPRLREDREEDGGKDGNDGDDDEELDQGEPASVPVR